MALVTHGRKDNNCGTGLSGPFAVGVYCELLLFLAKMSGFVFEGEQMYVPFHKSFLRSFHQSHGLQMAF